MKIRFSPLAPSAPLLKGRHFKQYVNSSLHFLSGKNNARSLFIYDSALYSAFCQLIRQEHLPTMSPADLSHAFRIFHHGAEL